MENASTNKKGMILNLTKEDIKDILKGTAATILASILLGVIKYSLDNGTKSLNQDFLINFIKWLGKPTPIDNWFLLLLLALIAFSIIRIVVRIVGGYLKPQKVKNKIEFEVKKVFQATETPGRLEKIEEDILICISKGENASISSGDLAKHFVAIPLVKFQFYIEKLRRSYYLEFNEFHHYYFLGQPGRAYLVKNNLV